MEPTPITPQAVKAELLRLAEQGNKPFTESLNPGVPNVLGIRIPHLRELAKKIAKGDWETYLATADTYYMEERMLQGMVLGCIRPDKDVEVYLAGDPLRAPHQQLVSVRHVQVRRREAVHRGE